MVWDIIKLAVILAIIAAFVWYIALNIVFGIPAMGGLLKPY